MILRETAFLRFFSLRKIPLLFFVSPTVEELTDERCVIRIPLNFRTRNHLGSMYFAALCIGADCAGGITAMRLIRESGQKVSLIFKDLKAEFLRRAEGDVTFTCEEGLAIQDLVQKALSSGQRENLPVHVQAHVPSEEGSPLVARFELTLSLKKTS